MVRIISLINNQSMNRRPLREEAFSDCRSKTQTTPRVTHSGKDEHGALYIPDDLIPLDPKKITLDHAKKYFDEYYEDFATDTDVIVCSIMTRAMIWITMLFMEKNSSTF